MALSFAPNTRVGHAHSFAAAVSRTFRVFVLLSATLCCRSIAAECLQYGAVTLTGRLVQQVYPGPPEYESVTRGDQPLVIWILQLDTGVCVGNADSSYPIAYSEREIQLVVGTDPYVRTDAYAPYRNLLGKRISVVGRLLAGGGQYEKRFVIAVENIARARRQK